MYCEGCGTKLNGRTRFCHKCSSANRRNDTGASNPQGASGKKSGTRRAKKRNQVLGKFLYYTLPAVLGFLASVVAMTLTSDINGNASASTTGGRSLLEQFQKGFSSQHLRLSYNSDDAKDTFAIWKSREREVEIGFFPAKITADESELFRAKKSLLALPNKMPDAIVTLGIKKGSESLGPESVHTYNISFPRFGAESGYGAQNQYGLNFTFDLTKNPAEQMPKLNGVLSEGHIISGTLSSQVKSDISGRDAHIFWRLSFSTPITDIYSNLGTDVPSETSNTEAAKIVASAIRAEPLGDTSSLGLLSIDREVSTIKSIVPILYKDESDIAFGLYDEELSVEEIAEIQSKRSLHRELNGKRPKAILILEYPNGSKELTRNNLEGYLFYFLPNSNDSSAQDGNDAFSLHRDMTSAALQQNITIKGYLISGSKLSLTMLGDSKGDSLPSACAWDLHFTVPLP